MFHWMLVGLVALVAGAPAESKNPLVPPEPFTLPGQKDQPSEIPTTSVTAGCGGVCEGKGCPAGWRPVGDKAYSREMLSGVMKGASAVKAVSGSMTCKCICVEADAGQASAASTGGASVKASEENAGQQLAANPKQQDAPSDQVAPTKNASAIDADTKPIPVAASGPKVNGELYGQCTFVVNLHVRKCGGTSVRELFNGMDGWEQSGKEQGLTYCSSMKQHVEAAVPGPKKWIEIHCEENLHTFNVGVTTLRAKLEPLGCKVVSTLLLRNPVEQGISEWLYFFKDQVDGMRESGNPMEWASDYLAWAKAHTEEELRLLTTPDSVSPHDLQVWEPIDEAAKGTPLPALASCDAALSMAKAEMAKVDVVATMDTPEEFAAFWVSVAKKAGFEPTTELSQQLFNTHGDTDVDPSLSPEDREMLVDANSCSRQVVELARARNSDVSTSLFSNVLGKDKVALVIEKWGGKQRIATALRERERPTSRSGSVAFGNSTFFSKGPAL